MAKRKVSFRTKAGKAVSFMAKAKRQTPNGSVKRITGQIRGKKIRRTQSVLVPKKIGRSKTDARAKVRRLRFNTRKLDTTRRFFRFRQRSPKDFKKKSFRTVTISQR